MQWPHQDLLDGISGPSHPVSPSLEHHLTFHSITSPPSSITAAWPAISSPY